MKDVVVLFFVFRRLAGAERWAPESSNSPEPGRVRLIVSGNDVHGALQLTLVRRPAKHLTMNFLIIVVVAIAVIAIVLAVLRMKLAVLADQAAVAKPEAYYLRDSLFSPAERSFFGVLETLRPAGVTITCKVRLADIFGPKKGLEPDDRQRALNRISAKHVDFLLIQKSDGRPLLGIELDDCSYEEEARVARDAFVDQVFSAAGLPLLHFTARSAYDPKEVRRQVDEALAKTGPDAVVS